MSNSQNRNGRDENRADPNRAATDPRAAEQQRQLKADHDAIEASARRVAASGGDAGTTTDPEAAAQQDRIKADHDALEESARRVRGSVPRDVREEPIRERHSDHR
jgi:hypothetical protein